MSWMQLAPLLLIYLLPHCIDIPDNVPFLDLNLDTESGQDNEGKGPSYRSIHNPYNNERLSEE